MPSTRTAAKRSLFGCQTPFKCIHIVDEATPTGLSEGQVCWTQKKEKKKDPISTAQSRRPLGEQIERPALLVVGPPKRTGVVFRA